MANKEQIDEVMGSIGVDSSAPDEGFDPMPVDEGFDEPDPVEAEAPEPEAEPEGDPPDPELVKEIAGGEEPEAPEAKDIREPDEEESAGQESQPEAPENKEETAEKTDAEKALEEGAKKPSDEFGELPKDAKEETKQRFDSMKARFDEVSEERDKLKEQTTQWVETVQSTGTNPEQFGQALEYLKAVNAGDVQGLEKAYEFLQNELAVLGKALGRSGGGYDPLDEHEDLRERVENGYIDREDALQIASARALTNTTQQAQAAAQQQQTTDSAKTQGYADLSKLGAELRAKDASDYQLKSEALGGYVQRLVREGVPPEQWAMLAKSFYESIPAPAAQPPTPDPRPNTLRPSGAGESGRGVEKEPGSMLEAVKMGLNM